jgi:DNA (cytosine-5)-methyltransferase 1
MWQNNKEKQPKAFFLENVKGLTNHRSGKLGNDTKCFTRGFGYIVPEPKVMNAKNFGVPQNRERIFIVGFRADMGVCAEDFQYPEPTDTTKCIADIMEKKPVSAKYYLSTKYLECLEKHKQRNEAKGNGFGYEIKDINSVSNTIVTGGMGRERNLIIDKRLKDFTPVTHIQGEVNRQGIRKMTPREWARLQGFPDSFKMK